MDSRALTCFVLGLAMAAPPSADAWSEAAHRAVAKVAFDRLGANARNRHRLVMGRDSKLEDIAAWADTVLHERPETEAWHSITIPPGATELDLQRDCPVGDCVTVKVREFEGIVRLAFKPRSDVTEALRFLVNLAVDMHQPLNAGYPPDRGGDEIPVVADGKHLLLYDWWDSTLFADQDEEALAQRLREIISDSKAREWSQGTLRDWTWDTHLTAVRVAYGALPQGSPKQLDGFYADHARAVAEEQLAKAAVRLAVLLDRIWP
jgi:hypothetical protein